MKHPSVHMLVDYLIGDLTETEKQDIETHVTSCDRCNGQLLAIRRIVSGMDDQALVSPPGDLIGRVVTAFHRALSRSPQRESRQADLQFDSWTRLAPLGVRGVPQERQILFNEGDVDLDLQIVKDGTTDDFVVRGQILGDESHTLQMEGIELRITDDTGSERRGLTDSLGRFSFSHLPGGTYSLRVILSDHDVILDSLTVH